MVNFCSICLLPLSDYVELSCHHLFHLQCINTWYHRYLKETCPMCRNTDRKIITYFPKELFLNEIYKKTLDELIHESEIRRFKGYYQQVLNELIHH
jgi:hypothetical protein